jgi:hypothetical protein
LAFSLFGLAILVFPSVRVVMTDVLLPVRHRNAFHPLTGQVRLTSVAAPVFSFLNCGGVIHGYPKMRGFDQAGSPQAYSDLLPQVSDKSRSRRTDPQSLQAFGEWVS